MAWAWSKLVHIQYAYTCIFAVGAVFARASLFERFRDRLPGACTWKLAIAVLLAVWVLRVVVPHFLPVGERVDIVLAVPLVWSLVVLMGDLKGPFTRLLELFGRHSTTMWLTHSLVTIYYFPQVAMIPRLPLLVLLWCIALSLAVAVAVDFVYGKLSEFVGKHLPRAKASQ